MCRSAPAKKKKAVPAPEAGPTHEPSQRDQSLDYRCPIPVGIGAVFAGIRRSVEKFLQEEIVDLVGSGCRSAPAKKTKAVPPPEAVPTPDKFPEGFARCSRGEAEWITLEQPRNFPASEP